SAEPKRILAERRSRPVFARGRRVALVEDQINHLEHRRKSRGELGPARNLEGHALLSQGPFGPDDPLRDGGLSYKKCARDLLRRQTSKQPEGERDAGLARDPRMTGNKHEAEKVIAHLLVQRCLEILSAHRLPGLHLLAKLVLLRLEPLPPAQEVDRAIF